MRIEIKQNQIVIEFSQKETNFIAQKAGKNKVEEVGNYIKEEIAKLFALHEIESDEISGWGHDFNLDTIKTVSDELNKRKGKASQSAQKLESLGFQARKGKVAVPEVPVIPEVPIVPERSAVSEQAAVSEGPAIPRILDIANIPPVSEIPLFPENRAVSEIEADAEITATAEADEIEEIGDELLADLLDKDLLKGKQKPKKGAS